MRKNRIYKTFMIPFLMVMMVFGFNTGAVLGDDDPGTDGPFKTRNGKFTLMHDDEIAGFAAPPTWVSSTDHLVGWAFYPDEGLNLTEKVLDTDALKMTNSDYTDFGLPATAVGRMHTTDNDGIFVAYVDTDMYVRVAEYDPATGTRWISPKWSNAVMPKLTWGYGIGKYLDCATGDFDDDGVDELVVAYRDGNYPTLIVLKKGTGSASFDLIAKYKDTDIKMVWQRNLGVTTFHPFDGGDYVALAAEGPGESVTTFSTYIVGTNSITKDKSVTSKTDKSTGDNNSVDIAGGDFDGDGYDELVGIDSWESAALLDYDDHGNLTLLHRDGNSDPGDWLENHIATGDLDGDGDEEAVSACRLYAETCNLAILVYDFDDTLAMTRKFYKKYQIDLQHTEDSISVGAVDVAVGNFDGKKDIAMEVAVVFRTLTAHQVSQTQTTYWPTYGIQIYKATAGTLALTRKKESTYVIDQSHLDWDDSPYCPKIVVAAGDFDGDSVVLGEPEHWQIQDHLDFSAVIAEPPKHIDYVKDIDGTWKEVNVSRVGASLESGNATFYTQYEYSSTEEITTTVKDTTAKGWGVKVSTEAEADFGIADIATINVNVTAGVDQTYEKRKETWNSSYASKTVGTALEAVNDDYLVYTAKNIDVWRYPVIGEEVTAKSGKKGPLYLQMTFPKDKTPHFVSGRSVEWYQPVHENGNIFSYPYDTSQIPNFDTAGLETKLQDYYADSNQGTHTVTWVNAGSEGKEVSTEKKVAVDASVSVGGTIFDVDTSLSVDTHYDQTWGSLTSSETTNSQSKGISIYTTPLNDSYVYQYTPLIFKNATTGVLQVNHLVDPYYAGTTAKTFWVDDNYGEKDAQGNPIEPDPALNLPHRWQSTDFVNWTFDPNGANFEMMRGLFFLDSDGKPFGYSVRDTDDVVTPKKPVTVKARIYNYSFNPAKTVEVKFQAQASSDNATWGPLVAMGDVVTISEIQGFGNASKKPNWEYAEVTVNTTDMPLEAGHYYRFWVTVDPENKIVERTGHDNGDTYANNTGFFGIPLYVQAAGAEGAGPTLPPADVAIEDVSFSDDMPVEGEEVLISAWVSSVGGDLRHVPVYFYEGHPDEGGKPFDVELIPYLKDNRPYKVTVPYKTAGKIGPHDIFIVAENDSVEMVLTVIDKPWKDKIIDQLK